MSLRKTASLTALLSFILLMVTSVILFIVPAGRVAYWSGWRLGFLSKEQWGAVHINLGVLFFAAVCLHAYFNWKPMTSYLKSRARKLRLFTPEFTVSLALTLAVFWGTLGQIPPLSTVIDLGAAISDRANLKFGEPPYGHAELSPLQVFAKRVEVDLDEALAALRAAGIRVADAGQTLEEIAHDNGIVPRDVYAAMQPAHAGDDARSQMPATPPGGTGNRTLVTLCEVYGLDLDGILRGLAEKGITAAGDMTVKEVAAANRLDPHGVYTAIYQVAHAPRP